jgi:uncharacterized membrane protein YhhN
VTAHLPALICVVSTGVLMWSELREAKRVRSISKAIAASSFIAYAVTMGATHIGTPGTWVLAALVLCMVGDLCLLSREKAMFLAGIGAFLLGHVAYIGAFASLGVHTAGTAVAAALVAVIAALVWQWLSPHTGNLTLAVAAYVVVISAMVAMATGSAILDPSPGRLGLWAAAAGFFCSDLCVARDRFVVPGPQNRMIGLPLYFGSQLAFAAAIGSAVG